jgi:hypothetical protein
MYRVVRWTALMVFAWSVTRSLPGLARYFRMRSM